MFCQQVHLAIPITFLLICTFLVFLPLYVRPIEVGMGILITASGIPVYLVGVYWKKKPEWFKQIVGKGKLVFGSHDRAY